MWLAACAAGGFERLLVKVRITSRGFSFCRATQAIKRKSKNPERAGQVGHILGGVRGGQFPVCLCRLLGRRQRLGRAAQLREPGAEVGQGKG